MSRWTCSIVVRVVLEKGRRFALRNVGGGAFVRLVCQRKVEWALRVVAAGGTKKRIHRAARKTVLRYRNGSVSVAVPFLRSRERESPIKHAPVAKVMQQRSGRSNAQGTHQAHARCGGNGSSDICLMSAVVRGGMVMLFR